MTGSRELATAAAGIARGRARKADGQDSPSAGAVPASRRNPWPTVVTFGQRLLFGLALIGLWQLAVTFELADHTVTSSPREVGDYLWQALPTSELWLNLWATTKAMLIAFVLAAIVGVTGGIGLALLPAVERVVGPYLDALNAMPRIALAPVFVVAFGITMTAKVALAFSVVVFVMITAARAGVRSADPDVTRLAAALGANRRQMFVKVLLPVATPSIFGGLRLSVIYALLGVVTAELLAAQDGMGFLLQQYAAVFRTDAMYGVLIVLAVMASLVNQATGLLEKRALRWQPPAD